VDEREIVAKVREITAGWEPVEPDAFVHHP